MLVFPPVLLATEEYDLTITMPISSSGSNVELRQVTFVTFYSQLETQVDAVTWDPCKARDQATDCNIEFLILVTVVIWPEFLWSHKS